MPTPVRMLRRPGAATLLGTLVLAATALACGLGSPTTPATSASSTDSPTVILSTSPSPSGSATSCCSATHSPSPTRTTHPPTSPPPLGDLTVHRAGTCTWYVDSGGGLWLNPTLAASWVGAGGFPSNGFSMTSNYGKATAGGPVTSAAPFTWAIGGEPVAGNAFLGHTVVLTVTIDAVHTVAETNEGNNVTHISVFVPPTPPGTTEVPVLCS